MSTQSQVMQLEELIPKLPAKNQSFALSLCGQFRSKRRLSESQKEWVDKLIHEARNPPPPPPPPPQIDLGVSFKPLHDLFGRARQNKIQHPTIKTQLDDGTKVKLSLASSASANAGSVYVNKGDEYYGKIDSEGRLTLARRMPVCEELHTLVQEIGANPSVAGKVHGNKYDNCMFCGRDLKTTDSVYFGYGPICAEKWGLEWGTAREHIVEDRVNRNEQIMSDAIKAMAAKFKLS